MKLIENEKIENCVISNGYTKSYDEDKDTIRLFQIVTNERCFNFDKCKVRYTIPFSGTDDNSFITQEILEKWWNGTLIKNIRSTEGDMNFYYFYNEKGELMITCDKEENVCRVAYKEKQNIEEKNNTLPEKQNNFGDKKTMKELTPKVIQTFSVEERVLYRAGFYTEDKNWTDLAKGFATDMFLNSQKIELVKLAQEMINEERENTIGNLFNVAKNKIENEI